MYFLFKLKQDVPTKKHNWRYPGTNWFNNDIDVFRKKAGENLDEYIQTYNLSVDYFIRSYLKEENEKKWGKNPVAYRKIGHGHLIT